MRTKQTIMAEAKVNPRFRVKKFASLSKNDGPLMECLLDAHKQVITTHAEALAALAEKPHDRHLLRGVKENKLYVSASCNLVASMRGKKPTHWPKETHECMIIISLMDDLWKSICEEKQLRKRLVNLAVPSKDELREALAVHL